MTEPVLLCLTLKRAINIPTNAGQILCIKRQDMWRGSQFFPISHNMMKLVILALAAATVVLGAPQYDEGGEDRDGVREGIRNMRMPGEEMMPDKRGF